MCGLSGLICLTATRCGEDHARIVAKMRDVQVHRGPDDSGIADLGHVCLASNRLAIIDLSSAGHMPMTDGEGRWIAYNGEVYNFQALREELAKLGHTFKSRTDTEVVLHAWREWGDRCFERFSGMFACAIYDTHTDTVVLARDRFGKKPLYYAQRDGHILFASELKTLASVCSRLEPNHQRIAEWSLYRNVDFGASDTLFAGISSLPPGHFLEIRGRQLGTPRRYFAPEAMVSRELYEKLSAQPVDQLLHEIDRQIADGIHDRLMADVPVGTLCSGGIDSSLITALCARERPDMLAFNIAVKGYKELDESAYAEKVTDSLGIRLISCPANGQIFRDNLARAIYFSDQPLTHPNSVFFMKVSELAREHGVLVLLSGEAADELFGGYVHRYRRYAQIKRMEAWLRYVPKRVRRAISAAGYASDRVPITEFSDYEGLLAHATSFLDRFARAELRARSAAAYGFVANEADREVLGAMLADITNFLTPLLRRLDRMTMSASVECRAPFLDQRLVHTMVNLPLSFRLRGRTDKWALKTIAAKYLPREIVHRKKLGFPLPVADFLAPLAQPALFENGFCTQVLGMSPAGLAQAVGAWRGNVNGFFNLLALEIWGRMFFFHQSVDEVSDRLRHAGASRAGAQRAPQAA